MSPSRACDWGGRADGIPYSCSGSGAEVSQLEGEGGEGARILSEDRGTER